ncbi:hypothetical protein LEN26_014928 [Aphanomyces euteiches]|nr:hypothetical protein LEN26_014928 [Aphanomyces euteiches]KAH9106048.1 hypothetical protein AeMF1_018230 [Aphanomyces euteiches]KAH9192611.1 hypothetical protein AeNC1_005405 [Aphanomyces euteiches]
MVNESTMSTFGNDLLDALRVHCSALNGLDTDSLDNYMKIVDSRVAELNSGLTHARTLFQAGAGLNIAQTGPAIVAATNFYNPAGWVASGLALGASVSATVCKTLGEKALSKTADMIRDSPRFIEESASSNAIAQTSLSMAKLLLILKQKLGDEKLNHAYTMLMGSLMVSSGDNDAMLFDVDDFDGAMCRIVNLASSPEFPRLLRLVRDASLSALSATDLVQRYEPAMRDTILKLVVDQTTKGMSGLALFVGCSLRSASFSPDKGMNLFMKVMTSFGHFRLHLPGNDVASVALFFEKVDRLCSRLSVIAIVCSLVSAGIAISELIQLDQLTQPYQDAIDSLLVSHREFAHCVNRIPTHFRDARQNGAFQGL